ncbi:MAG: large repetitive protein [Frankiaceae bacterium]|nr:large repetitive protein [Frankiaceae bacterium]
MTRLLPVLVTGLACLVTSVPGAAAGGASSIGEWTLQQSAAAPSPRFGAAMAYDPVHRQVVLFGGFTDPDTGVSLADTWTWDGTAWTDVTPPDPPRALGPSVSPPARSGAAMAWDGREVVLFGGAGDTGPLLGDTWTWDGTGWTEQHPTASPPARSSGAAAWDGHEVVLFGGWDPQNGPGYGGDYGDTWTWDGTERTWTARSPRHTPSARKRPLMTYDRSRGAALLAGGANAVLRNDAWSYRDGDWTEVVPDCVPNDCMPGGSVLVAYDGFRPIAFDNSRTWLMAHGRWQRSAAAEPNPRRVSVGSAYDELHGQVVMFGGLHDEQVLGETWLWTGRAGPPATSPPPTGGPPPPATSPPATSPAEGVTPTPAGPPVPAPSGAAPGAATGPTTTPLPPTSPYHLAEAAGPRPAGWALTGLLAALAVGTATVRTWRRGRTGRPQNVPPVP